MSLGQLGRTARHLLPVQWWALAQRQARHAVWRAFPRTSRAQIARVAAALPWPDIRSEPLRAVAEHVRLLQATVHGADTDAARRGCFRFLGRTVDFGAFEKIEWRRPLEELSSPLWRLTLAYFGWAVPILAAGDKRGRELVAAAVTHLDKTIGWDAPGVFRDVWNPYTASHRLINLLAGMALAPSKFTCDQTSALLEHARFCAAFVSADLERDLQVNHLFKNYTALAVFSAATAHPERLWPYLGRAVSRGLAQIILDDGGHVERSPMYHALGLMDMRMLRDSAIFISEWQPALDRRIARAERALSCLTHPDGEIALFNDAWQGGAPTPRALGIPDPPHGRHDLAVTGYSLLNGGPDRVILDCGPLGPDFNPAHGHADFLSLEASVAGHRLIVDPGTPTYVAGPERNLCRSAASHNGPRLMRSEPVEFWKSFRVGRRATAGLLADPQLAAAPLWAAGWHDGYRQQNVDIRRWVGLWPAYGLVIIDLWNGATDDGVSTFLVGPSFAPDGIKGRFVGPHVVTFQTLAGELTVLGPAPHWPRYGEQESATGLQIRPSSFSATGLAAVWGEGQAPWHTDIVNALLPLLARASRVDQSFATFYGNGP